MFSSRAYEKVNNLDTRQSPHSTENITYCAMKTINVNNVKVNVNNKNMQTGCW